VGGLLAGPAATLDEAGRLRALTAVGDMRSRGVPPDTAVEVVGEALRRGDPAALVDLAAREAVRAHGDPAPHGAHDGHEDRVPRGFETDHEREGRGPLTGSPGSGAPASGPAAPGKGKGNTGRPADPHPSGDHGPPAGQGPPADHGSDDGSHGHASGQD
jgi:hypothetical protein